VVFRKGVSKLYIYTYIYKYTYIYIYIRWTLNERVSETQRKAGNVCVWEIENMRTTIGWVRLVQAYFRHTLGIL